MTTHYEVLNVTTNASDDDIKKVADHARPVCEAVKFNSDSAPFRDPWRRAVHLLDLCDVFNSHRRTMKWPSSGTR